MKKEQLIESVNEVRKELNSDAIVQSFSQAWSAGNSHEQRVFATNVMIYLVDGTGNYQRFNDSAHEVCKLLDICQFYEGAGSSEILHHIAQAKTTLSSGQPQHGSIYRKAYLETSQTLTFVEAHKRVIAIASLLNTLLHAERSVGELLLEATSNGVGPSLDAVRDILSVIADLVSTYSESQGEVEKPVVNVTYLDLGSNYQIGVKVDAKAELGANLTRFLTEVFKWLTNPRAYMRARRAEEMTKEIGVLADLQKRVDKGELTVEAANVFGARLLGCAQKLANHGVFPASMLRERTTTSTAAELEKLLGEPTPPPTLPAPEFVATSASPNSTASDRL